MRHCGPGQWAEHGASRRPLWPSVVFALGIVVFPFAPGIVLRARCFAFLAVVLASSARSSHDARCMGVHVDAAVTPGPFVSVRRLRAERATASERCRCATAAPNSCSAAETLENGDDDDDARR